LSSLHYTSRAYLFEIWKKKSFIWEIILQYTLNQCQTQLPVYSVSKHYIRSLITKKLKNFWMNNLAWKTRSINIYTWVHDRMTSGPSIYKHLISSLQKYNIPTTGQLSPYWNLSLAQPVHSFIGSPKSYDQNTGHPKHYTNTPPCTPFIPCGRGVRCLWSPKGTCGNNTKREGSPPYLCHGGFFFISQNNLCSQVE